MIPGGMSDLVIPDYDPPLRKGQSVSIWSSVQGFDPVAYDAGYGEEALDDAWVDVALSAFGNRVRILVEDENGTAAISLDAAGIAELHRRIVVARTSLEGSSQQ